MLKYQSILEAFDASSKQSAGRIALIDGTERWTYSQLARRSAHLARHLLARGVGPGTRVGLYAQRSAETIAAMLAILRTGAAYVPLDPTYPPKLLHFLCTDSAPTLLLTSKELLDTGADPFWGCEALPLMSSLFEARELDDSEAAAWPMVGPDSPAYIMYTSGSTGRPKGVVVPHRAVVRLVCDNHYADLGPEETLLHLAPLSFDASTFEIWGALLNGGRLAIAASSVQSLDDIAAAIKQHEVSTAWLTAGLFHLMIDTRPEALRPLRQLLAGGDVLSPPHVAKALGLLERGRLINGYGPTENTTFSCCYTVPADYRGDAPLPIGRPIDNTQAYILDESLRPVPMGETGELYLGGAGLALGYFNRPELTAERFVSNPFESTPGARLYRTGDRARLRADGNIEFLGRADRQVKINGKRVELDEIEARLRACALVQDAAVICDQGAGSQRRLVAYITSRGPAPNTTDEVRRHLRNELPDFMIPGLITRLDALPLSPNGKVDRNRLPQVGSEAAVATVPATATATESLLLGLWREALGNETIGLRDNFFDAGGTSLQLLQVHARLSGALGRAVPVVELFQFPTICALAAHLSSSAPTSGRLEGQPLSAQERARRQQAALKRKLPAAVKS